MSEEKKLTAKEKAKIREKKLDAQWAKQVTDPIKEFKATLKQVEIYGLSDEDRAAVAADTGSWPGQVQLLVSAYIKHLRFKQTVMHKSLEVLASGMIKPEDAAEFAQGALEQVCLRDWKNIPNQEAE
jgi:hypothetical protein